MATLTKNGISTTTQWDSFRYNVYKTPFGRHGADSTRVQWDYRDKNGTLHSGIAKSIEEAIEAAKKHGYQKEAA